eukprot:73618-Lingulodinium_polyedra.AAC.1
MASLAPSSSARLWRSLSSAVCTAASAAARSARVLPRRWRAICVRLVGGLSSRSSPRMTSISS